MWLLLVAASVHLAFAQAEPPPLPSGMDLLYDDHIPVLPSGEPIVTMGIMDGVDHVRLHASRALHVRFFAEAVAKETVVPAGQDVEIRMQRAQPAARQYYVDLQGVPMDNKGRLETAVKLWQSRDVGDVSVLEEGTVLGIGGRVLDNRDFRVVTVVRGSAEATRLAARINRQFGGHAQVLDRLLERPWGELRMRTNDGVIGVAVSYARFTTAADGVIEVADVEYGRGYAWHGYANRAYRADIYTVVDPNGQLTVVNAVPAETMLAGVVPAEIFSEAPSEALKAQAVAARNTLLAKLGRRHHDAPYHLCSEQHCQVYGGVSKEDARATTAVQATFGQALFLGGRLVDAVYSSSCGGHTEDNDVVWGDNANPALRGRPDWPTRSTLSQSFAAGLRSTNMSNWVDSIPLTYCSSSSRLKPDKFRWQKTYDAATVNTMVRKNYGDVGTIRDIVVRERGSGGRVVRLEIAGSNKRVVVNRELPIRQLFGNLNSAAFVVATDKDASGALRHATFRGAGWGHGVGMCQQGAIGRAEAGQRYTDILGFYYSGAHVEQLYDKLQMPDPLRDDPLTFLGLDAVLDNLDDPRCPDPD